MTLFGKFSDDFLLPKNTQCLHLEILGGLANRPQLPHPLPHHLRLLGGHDLPLSHPGAQQVSDGHSLPVLNVMCGKFRSKIQNNKSLYPQKQRLCASPKLAQQKTNKTAEYVQFQQI